MECGQFGEDIADEDLDLRAEEDAGGVVAEPEGAGAEFVVGFERVAFFGVHALDFDVEVQGFTWRVAPGDRGNKQTGKSTPLWHFDLGIFLDGRSPILLERRSGVGGHRHAATVSRLSRLLGILSILSGRSVLRRTSQTLGEVSKAGKLLPLRSRQ